MNEEASSSAAPPHHESPEADSIANVDENIEDEAILRSREVESALYRKSTGKRKRIAFLDSLLRELDMLIYLQLITIYYMDCSFFWLFIRGCLHLFTLTPLPDLMVVPPREEQRAFLPLILAPYITCSLLHLTFPRPSAGEDTRGYLHGGMIIDFIGQQGPSSKFHLAALDISVMVLQVVMLSVHVKRRNLKKRLPKPSGTETTPTTAPATETADQPRNPEQDADAEERGVLRRTDTFSDIGQEPDEEDELLPTAEDASTRPSAPGADLLDALNSGQVVIADLHVLDTLWEEHETYSANLTARSSGASNTASASLGTNFSGAFDTFRMRLGGG
ncbi:DUF1746-domain-containing protein [Mytilinidion resinicola]|uniref:DUF1746-domain-containing protein n=1 Tax=Mytilinidion resinicola TaxID=574789 RepID=A0A6A6Z0W2_9PEZI|nr:DUF1746-domain-containing protein [Mytilinidion resinicola]KAF2814660.1 DUF1746-domain-containing protein [Mytilinidion resinicola]